MSTCYNPVTDIVDGTVGRSLHGSSSHGGGTQQLRSGEHLYALCDRLIFKPAPCVDDQDDFDHFHTQYTSGHLISFRLVALDSDAHQRALSES